MNIKFLFLFFTLVIAQNTFSQCDSITVQNVTNFTPFALNSMAESDGLRNGPDYDDATLYFPRNGEDNLKSIVLVPGHLASQNSVALWARYLTSRGFVCMTIGTNSLNDNPTLRASALLDGMETIRQENNRISSPLFERLDTSNIAVGGWSMGGGGAQLAAKIDPRIKAVLAIAPWLSLRTPLDSDLNHTSPVLIISGQLDASAPPILHADLHYTNIPNSTNKLLFEVSLGSHYTPLYPSTGNGDIGNLAYAWLKLFLDDNPCYCKMLSVDSLDQNSTASKYLTNLNCSTLSATNVKHSALHIQIFPNPTTEEFNIKFSKQNQLEYSIYDVFGQQIKYGKVNSDDKIKIDDFASGTYFLHVNQQVFILIKK